MANLDPKHLRRLKEEQDKAIAETDLQIKQWEKFRADYVAVQEKLKTLPNKTTHPYMVPFGPLAFMPGQLVHTNEILVLLGDNYFVERSASQSIDIISRRLVEVDKNLESLKKQKDLLTPRTQFTSEMIDMAEGQVEQQEIVEPYDEKEERLWRERHRKYLRQAAEKSRREKSSKQKQTNESETVRTDGELWERLDQLEIQEREGQELEKLSNDGTDPTYAGGQSLGAEKRSQDNNRVKEGKDDEDSSSQEETDEEDDEETDEEDESDSVEETEQEYDETEEAEEGVPHKRRVITFSHSKTKEDPVADKGSMRGTGEGSSAINSPADLYNLVQTGLPKSILKTSSSTGSSAKSKQKMNKDEQSKTVTFNGEKNRVRHSGEKLAGEGRSAESDSSDSKGEQYPPPHQPLVQAFTDTVVERTMQPSAMFPSQSETLSQGQSFQHSSHRPTSRFQATHKQNIAVSGVGNNPSESTSENQNAPRRVSKFKASRQKQDSYS